MRRPLGDEVLVRRAARVLAVQVAALVATAMLLLVVLVTLVVVRGQQSATDRLLRTTAARADDVGDPPASAWVVLATAGRVAASPGLPEGVRTALVGLRSHPTAHPVLRTISPGPGASYRVITRARRDGTVQVVLDLRPQDADQDRLLRVMTVAAGLSLLVAAGIGWFLGRRAVRPLAQALALQRMFVADASHELRTPLTLLSTRVQLLDGELRSGNHDPQTLADSRGVVSDVARLGDVVEDLLVAADPRRDEDRDLVPLGELIDEVASSARPHAGAAGVRLSAGSTGHEAALAVRGSATALRRAVLSLVDNAIDHTPTGGQVRLEVRRQRREVIVSVSDTGPGIAPVAADRVLRRFHSGGQRAGRAHYGLGLALTHDVANRHGGTLRLAPAETGTTFELVLPAADP